MLSTLVSFSAFHQEAFLGHFPHDGSDPRFFAVVIVDRSALALLVADQKSSKSSVRSNRLRV